MMQIVLNTLQTDSGDQPGSGRLSQKQKIKGDWEAGPSLALPAVGCAQARLEGPRRGCRPARAPLWVEEAQRAPGSQHPKCVRSPSSLGPSPGLALTSRLVAGCWLVLPCASASQPGKSRFARVWGAGGAVCTRLPSHTRPARAEMGTWGEGRWGPRPNV